jgi:tetratricopeptide (TPR) repeat protein
VVAPLLASLALVAATAPGCDPTMYYLMRGDYDRALRHLEAVATAGGSEAERENLRGLTLLLSGKTAAALESFDRALVLQPSLSQARFNRSIALIKTRDYAQASKELEKVYSDTSSPLRASAAYHNALALEMAGEDAQAERWAAEARALDPKHDAATLLHGVLLERRRDFQGAGKAYRDFLGRNPDSIVGLLRFGVAAHRAGFTDTAVKYLRRVIELAPHSFESVEARKFLVMWE